MKWAGLGAIVSDSDDDVPLEEPEEPAQDDLNLVHGECDGVSEPGRQLQDDDVPLEEPEPPAQDDLNVVHT
jgi:hypothetical protein